MSISVSEIKGYDGLRAFWAFHKMMLGLKMLPAYMGESYEDFFETVSEMPFDDQMKMIREAAIMVELENDEVEAFTIFCKDPNGVPYSKENLKNLKPDQFYDIIVAVCTEIIKIKVDFVSDTEKKK